LGICAKYLGYPTIALAAASRRLARAVPLSQQAVRSRIYWQGT
jgi:hypothetical protein